MQIEFEIDQQRLTRTSDAYLIEGSKNFVECIFSFSSDWAELDKWALFKRDNNTYEIYIEDNKCLVPIQCTSAEGEFTISVVGRKNAENVTGTASDKLLTVRGSEFVGGMGEEGRLTETYLVEVLGEVKDLREKAATSEANAAESAQNAKGYADKAKEYSESVNVYIPSVSQDGVMTWTNKAGLANPTPVNVKGERGEKGEQGAKGDTGATGAKGERGEQGPQGLQGAQGLRGEKGEKGDQGTGVTIKGKYDSLSALMAAHPTGKDGDAYMVGVNLYAWSGTEWIDCGNIQGAKGERGEQGPQGLQGAKGEKGEKGDAFKYTDFTAAQLAALKGPQGDRGLQGERGETGPRGATGPQGAKGDKGDAFTYADFTQEQLAGLKGPQGDKGLQGLQGERGERGLQGLQGIQGVKGDTGTPATVRIGTVETGAAGTSASVTNSGTASAAVFDFIIPKGDKGATGDRGPQGLQGERGLQGLQGPKGNDGAAGAAGAAATIKVGVVTTGAAGTAAKVTNSGTTSAAVLDFVIPQGPKGDKGEQGAGSIVAVDSELSSTSTNPVQNKVVKAAIDTVKKNMSQGFQTVTDSIPTKVSALENDAEYLKKGANIWVERYYTYVKSGTSDAPQVHVAQYTTSTGSFVIDLGYFTSNLTGGQSLVFTAYIQSTSDTAGTLTINNAGTIKYIGAASDLAITKAGLLLTVLMTKDWNDVVTSILQASKLGGGA